MDLRTFADTEDEEANKRKRTTQNKYLAKSGHYPAKENNLPVSLLCAENSDSTIQHVYDDGYIEKLTSPTTEIDISATILRVEAVETRRNSAPDSG